MCRLIWQYVPLYWSSRCQYEPAGDAGQHVDMSEVRVSMKERERERRMERWRAGRKFKKKRVKKKRNDELSEGIIEKI